MPTKISLAQPWDGHEPDAVIDVSNDTARQLVADGWARLEGDPLPESDEPDTRDGHEPDAVIDVKPPNKK